jgi:putative Holliday junction resolvase
MDGSLGSQAEKVRSFVGSLSHETAVPIEYRDERLTTLIAKRLVQEARKTSRETRYDAAAAALILLAYLEDVHPPKDYHQDEETE